MYYNFHLDVAAIVIYVMVILLYLYKPHIRDDVHRIYLALFSCATLAPAADIVCCISIRNNYPGYYVYASNSLNYLFVQGTCFFFLMYIIKQMEKYQKISVPKKILLRAPVILETILIITNDFNGWIFTYSPEEGYKTGPLHWTLYVVSFMYFVWAFAYISVRKKAFDRSLRLNVYNICVVNLISIILQTLLPYDMITHFGFAISMLLLYLTMHSKNSALDHDTGMLNRFYLSDVLTKLIYTKSEFSVVLVRVADYSVLSGIYGMSTIEKLVKNVGKQLTKYVAIGDSFQTNTSTFALLIHNKDSVGPIVSRIAEELNGEWEVDDQRIPFAYLVTEVRVPEKASSMDELMAYLIYFEKMKKMRYGIIPESELQIHDRVREMAVEKAIRRGLSENYMSVYYQPMCLAKTQRFMTAEALVRLIDPELGFVSPGEFIPVAERCGLMIAVGNYVLDEVCKFIAEHDMEELGLEYIEVNLSVVQCLQRDFMDIVHDTIEKYGIDSKYLCFEITETAANCAPEIFTHNLETLANEGFKLALDDFGTGYGNLQRMVTSHFTIVKFDREMTTQACSTEQLRNAFTRLVPAFCNLNLEIVAEGVETKEQYEFLRDIGIDYIQGFYFSKPLPAPDFVAYLGAHKSV